MEPVIHYHHGDDHGPLDPADFDPVYNPDEIELATVGVDVGSSTSHLAFSRLWLRRLGRSMSSRYVVVRREVTYQSPVVLTPYRPDQTIDADVLGRLVDAAFAEAGLEPGAVDSGAVILTGEAIRRVNARAIAGQVASRAGRLVCASAGHNLEALLAAHGSGAVEESRKSGRTILHVDVGGGTSKMAVVRAGEVVETAAVNVGGRLVAFDPEGAVTRIEPAARQVAQALGIPLALCAPLDDAARERVVAALLDCLLDALGGGPRAPLTSALLLTEPLSSGWRPEAITFSGGVSEFIYGRDHGDYGDLGRALGEAIAAAAADGRLPAALGEVSTGVRATVLGASQYTAQVSGDTMALTRPGLLPLRDLPVLHVRLAEEDVRSDQVAAGVADAYHRLDLRPEDRAVAVAVDWHGRPTYANLHALAEGVSSACAPAIAAGWPLVLVFASDVGRLVGEIVRRELSVAADIVSIDSVVLRELDFIDIGQVIEARRVVPVVVRSLVFTTADHRPAELAS